MNLLAINLLTIKPNEDKNSPYVVKDIKGTIVFYAKYEHEAEAFVRGVQFASRKQAERALWTDYEARYEVMEKNDLFYVYDHAQKEIVSDQLYANEIEAEDERDELIKDSQFQDNYETKSGR